MNIPLFKIYWDENDIKAVNEALKRGMNWAAGPNIEKFEKMIAEYLGRKYCLVFNSGTSALYSLFSVYSFKEDDEIIVPSFSFIATANAPLLAGAKPVFADIEEETCGLDANDVEKKITSKTKAIMPMHYGGFVCRDIKKLQEIAKRNNLLLIEDNAESFGAKLDGKFAGTFGDAAMISFCQTKVFTTGEGGCIVLDDKNIYEKLKLFRAHGRAENGDYFSGSEFMDYVQPGHNFRMTDCLAALGISQLEKVNNIIDVRRYKAGYMTKVLEEMKLEDVIIPETSQNIFNVYQEYPIRIKSGKEVRDHLKKFLAERAVGTRISFPPVHLSYYYKNVLGYNDKLATTERVSEQALSLPIYPDLTEEEITYIANSIKDFYKKNKMNNLSAVLVNKNSSIKETIRVIDQGALGVAFIVDEHYKLFGAVTDGDIRGAILKGISIEDKIEKIANKNPIVKKEGKSDLLRLNNEKALERDIHLAMPKGGSLRVPIIDDEKNIKDIIFVYENGQRDFEFKQKPKFNDKNIRKILIIGGAGYLGSVLCRKLLAQGYQVKVLDNLTYGDEGIRDLYQNENFEFLKGDIRNISDVVEAVKGVAVVIHLAAIVGDPASSLDTEETLEINYLATKSIVDICKHFQINKFLFASTCSVYGASQNSGERLIEDSSLNPVSLYAKTKLISEKGIISSTDENFSPTIFRFATLYGVSPRMRFDLVVNLFTAKALKDKKITIFGGNQWRPNIDVSDAALACLRWIESPIEKTGGEIFNIGSNEQNYQIIEIANLIRNNILQTEIEMKEKESDIRNYNVSFDKSLDILGFKAEKTVSQAVIEIKKIIEDEKIENFNNPKYSNYRFLSKMDKSPVFNNYMNEKILAIIPARGGSKRLPGKNIKIMAGKPLISYTIDAALKSRHINRIIVSTDCEEIAEVSKKYRAEVIERPEELAEDNVKMAEVVLHALEVLEKKEYIPDIIVLLQPTSPLRSADDIDKAIDIFFKNKNDCELVMGVCEINPFAYWALKTEGKYLKSLFSPNFLAEKNQSQDLSKLYIPNGSLFITTPKIIKKYHSIHSQKIMPYFMSQEKSIDIDDEADFLKAESILKRLKNYES